jgi:O-methyltransferase involved in polyketide biosynthesis
LHQVTAADVLDLGQLQLAAAGFDRDRPLVILCEGLVGYLTREETSCLTRNVHRLLSEFTGGSWIASAFEDGDDIAAFLHRVGFDVQVCSQVDKTRSFSTIAALDLSPAVIERMRPFLRVWLMRPVLR